MSDIDNSVAATDTVATTTVAPVPGSENTPATTTGPADTAVDGQPTEGEGEKPQPTRDRRAEKRIASLSRKNDEAQREIGYWRGIAEARQSQSPAATALAADAKPQPNQYKSYDEYVEALTDWKTEEKLTARELARASQDRRQSEDSKATERVSRVAERLIADAKDVADFDEVMETITAPNFPISSAMRDYLEEADRPALVAQWLSENQDKAKLIYGMNSAQVVRELDKVAATFAPKPVRSSSAPPPVPTVGGRSVTTRDPEKQSMKEYASDWISRRAAKH